MINSVMDATMNVPDTISNIFIANIMRCYKTIPLKGDNNLLDAITFITRHAYKKQLLSTQKLKCFSEYDWTKIGLLLIFNGILDIWAMVFGFHYQLRNFLIYNPGSWQITMLFWKIVWV